MTTESNGRSLSGKAPGSQPAPEEAALVLRIGVFVKMRWLAVAGILIASLLAAHVFHIRFPLLPVYFIAGTIALYNILFLYQARRLDAEARGLSPGSLPGLFRRLFIVYRAPSPLIERARVIGNIHITADLAALTVLLHYTGGIENPFVFYFIFHVILAGILLHYRIAYFTATSATFLVLLLAGLEYFEVIPHVFLEGFATAGLYRHPPYLLSILVALSTCLYASAYMVTSIAGELRKRQREVVSLQQKGLREKTSELEKAGREMAKLEEGRKHLLRFLAIASHDLKAPLSAVQSYLQLMLGGYTGKLTDKQKHMLERSSTRIREQLTLISDLLDISRIEGDQILNEMEEISLAAIVENSVENVRAQAGEKKIKLTTDIAPSLPTLRASSARLQQVITNLLANAVKFTPEKGRITLRVTLRDGNVYTEVSDTGSGISAEDLPRIFDDFYRGSDRETAGTGLGLSIARRVIEAHGGKIWAESPDPEDKQSRGSRFTFTLPQTLTVPDKARGQKRPGKKKSR